MNIKGLVFDLDGVITETAKLHYQAWKEEVAKIGITFTEKENDALKGLPRLDTLLAILKLHNRTNEFNDKELLKMTENKNNNYKKMLEINLNEEFILPNIIKLLEDAKNNNLKMAIASSSLNAPIILKKLNLEHYFDYIVDPRKLKGKPAPDIYLSACEGINIKHSEAIGFEDAMPGVKGLKSANIKTIAITHGAKGNWDIAELVVNSTKELELKKIIKKLNS